MSTEVRTIYVTGGYGDYLTLEQSITPPIDLSTYAFTFGYTPNPSGAISSEVPPTAWIAPTSPDTVQFPNLGEVVFNAFIGTGGHTITPGDYWAWLKAVASPIVQPLFCGRFTIV